MRSKNGAMAMRETLVLIFCIFRMLTITTSASNFEFSAIDATDSLTNILYDDNDTTLYVTGTQYLYILNSTLSKESSIQIDTKSENGNTTYISQTLFNDSMIICHRDKQVNCTAISLNKNRDHVLQLPVQSTTMSKGVALLGPNATSLLVAIPPPTDNLTMNPSIAKINVSSLQTVTIFNDTQLQYDEVAAGFYDINNKTGYFITSQTMDNGELSAKVLVVNSDSEEPNILNMTCNNLKFKRATIITHQSNVLAVSLFENEYRGTSVCVFNLSSNFSSSVMTAMYTVSINKIHRVTSMMAVPYAENLLLYVGTSTGTIYWNYVHFKSKTITLHQHKLMVQGEEITKLVFVNKRIVALTDKRVVLQNEAECSIGGTEWILKNNTVGSLCGWCVKNNSRTLFEDCDSRKTDNEVPNKYWMPIVRLTKFNILPGIRMGEIKEGQVEILSDFWNHTDNLTCCFGGKELTNCTYPIKTGSTALLPVDVRFYWNETSVVAEGTMYYYNCSSFYTSKECLIHNKWSKTTCTWCVCSEECVDHPDNCTNNDHIQTTKELPEIPYTPTMIQHVGQRNITIQGDNFFNNTQCAKNITYSSDRCSSVEYVNNTTLECLNISVEGGQDVKIYVKLGTENKLELGNVMIKPYNCTLLGVDCSTCQYHYNEYKCEWCQHDDEVFSCQFDSECNNKSDTCPNATIIFVSPTSTTLNGGEVITIKGKNLGRFSNDTVSVDLAGVPCDPIPKDFHTSNRLTCTAGNSSSATDGKVVVNIRNKTTTASTIFTYKNMSEQGLEFSMGPVSGGTKIVLRGTDFIYDDINRTRVTINNTFSCELTYISSSEIGCTTSPGKKGMNLGMELSYRDKVKIQLQSNFSYLPDPKLSYITPNTTIQSGGIPITLVGTGFNAIQLPEIGIGENTIFQPCSKETRNDTMIVCPAPTNDAKAPTNRVIGPIRRKREAESDLSSQQSNIKVKMDGVVLESNMTYVKDPHFEVFKEDGRIKQLLPATYNLVIKGERLNAAASASNYKVDIGNGSCKVFASLTSTTLICQVPKTEPGKVNASSEAPEVQVTIGQLTIHIGYLRYHYPTKDNSLYIIIGVLVAVVIALVIGGVIILRYASQRNKKKVKEGIEKMELEVKEQCREGFAELQTDMTDLTVELVELGIPFNNFFTYMFKFIFPNCKSEDLKSHVVLKELLEHEGTKEDLAPSMIQLDQLISNKFFIVTVIRTLDNQKKLVNKSRATLAGYFALLLMNRMDYFTEVIESLLTKLIGEMKQPKDLFKRSDNDTVTEKLIINWLAICMYNPLKKDAGSAVFILYKAIENVSNKFAIDALTGHCRATLSEHKLLMLDCQPEVLNITVMINNGKFQTTCRLLDCDSINQVKVKCLMAAYKKEQESERPGMDDVDLEWRISLDTTKLLYDEDSSSVIAPNGFRKLNTLKHYGVTDGSTVCLISKEFEGDYVNYKALASGSSREHLIQKPEDVKIELEALPTIHLVCGNEQGPTKKSSMMGGVHFNRLLQTKVNLKKFIDEMVDNIVRMDNIPYPVRHLFSIMEKMAKQDNISSSTVESWKINSFAIRLWTRLLSRPEVLFDLNKTTDKFVQPNMEIISLAFVDSCWPPHVLDKNSPTEQLLFYKDTIAYREKLMKFVSSTKPSTPVNSEELSQELANIPSVAASIPINRQSVLYEIYLTIDNFIAPIVADLDETTETRRLQLSEKLEHVFERMRNS